MNTKPLTLSAPNAAHLLPDKRRPFPLAKYPPNPTNPPAQTRPQTGPQTPPETGPKPRHKTPPETAPRIPTQIRQREGRRIYLKPNPRAQPPPPTHPASGGLWVPRAARLFSRTNKKIQKGFQVAKPIKLSSNQPTNHSAHAHTHEPRQRRAAPTSALWIELN